MGEKMTLEQAHRLVRGLMRVHPKGMLVRDAWETLERHLTQPAQAVDVLPTRITKAPYYWEVGGGVKQDAATGYCNGWNDCLATCAEALTAALPKDSNGAEGADGWRPIATAPKDGKEVLVAFTADGVRQVAEASWSDDEDVWVCSRDGFMLYRRNEPTHWMPLPDAPQEDTPDAAR